MEKSCLSCKSYKTKDIESGTCRVLAKENNGEAAVHADHCCDNWRDCGQQFHIRLGWIKARQQQAAGHDVEN